MLAYIVGIRAVADHRQAALVRQRYQTLPQLGLAVEAPVRGIGEIVRVLELAGLDLDKRDIELPGDLTGHAPLRIRIGGAAPNRREHAVFAELLAENDREVSGIDAAGIPKP